MQIILVGGIPLNKNNSFFWQFTLLKKGFLRRNIDTLIVSPIPESDNFKSQLNQDNIKYINYKSSETTLFFKQTLKKDSETYFILLGFPENFPFLDDIENLSKFYLWAQFSKPPDLSWKIKNYLNFVPLTETTSNYIVKSGAKKLSKVIPHAITTDIYKMYDEVRKKSIIKKYGINGQFVVGTVGKNIMRKRLNDVIEAFAMASKNISNTILLIKTDKKVSEFGYNLPFLIERHKLKHAVKVITGNYDREKMAEIYNCMDLYLQLSEWEGFGIPVIEAMACGVPVVTHNVQGPGEIVNGAGIIVQSKIQRDDSGAILSYANIKEVAEAIIRLYKNKSLRDALILKAHELILKRYRIEIVVDLWLKLFYNKT